ncbi:hypothetical protein RchiOBHm_Chr3g0479991 [Rosa chinensis]|uniref:Uncharacterized protein n=1 Tax=Rosa chinensis TaxID=74649 RepID=A0A2P6RDJ6_ROSCH|nr:hypothetical protein RchiOBHm_Chr3g0479991 [Rosa chinensis]
MNFVNTLPVPNVQPSRPRCSYEAKKPSESRTSLHDQFKRAYVAKEVLPGKGISIKF